MLRKMIICTINAMKFSLFMCQYSQSYFSVNRQDGAINATGDTADDRITSGVRPRRTRAGQRDRPLAR